VTIALSSELPDQGKRQPSVVLRAVLSDMVGVLKMWNIDTWMHRSSTFKWHGLGVGSKQPRLLLPFALAVLYRLIQ
jgi:hypothetical protein